MASKSPIRRSSCGAGRRFPAASPSAGFLIGWIFGAFVTGYLSERLVNHQQSGLVQTVSFFLAAMVGCIVVLYAFGITYLATAGGMGFPNAFIGSMAYLPGDVTKAFVAALLGRAVMVGYPLLPARA